MEWVGVFEEVCCREGDFGLDEEGETLSETGIDLSALGEK
jgi:hypothetical protein